MTPELTRPHALDRLGEPAVVTVETSEAERGALARRMGLPRILALSCRFDLRPGENRSVLAEGQLRARVVQICVVSLDPFEVAVVEEFRVRFVSEDHEDEGFDLEADDEIPYVGGAIDLGAAAAEQLALALNPFPRKPGAGLPVAVAAAVGSPFEALARFRSAFGRDDD